MRLVIDNFEQFKIFFDVVFDVTDLIELQLFESHMVCSILDKAHTRFMSVDYTADFFAYYEVYGAESVTIFADDMNKVIKSANKIDTVTLETNENYLICKIESRNGNSRVFEFVLPAETIQSPNPPSISLPVSFKLDLDDLKQGIKDLKIVGSSEIKFVACEDTLNILAGIEVSTNYCYNLSINNDVEDNISSRFSLEYIEQLLKFNKISKTVDLELGENHPLLYKFEDDVMGVKVNGMIAPRLEVED